MARGAPDKDHARLPPLVSAALHLNPDKVNHLLSSGAKPDETGAGGMTPLIASLSESLPVKSGFLNALRATDAILKRQEIVEKLLASGANPDASTFSGITPLMLAARNGASRVTSMLIKHHAAIDKRDDAGKGALDYAASHNHPTVFHMLIKAGAKYGTHKTKAGETLLAEAFEANAWGIAKWLIAHKAGINTPYSGTTPLIASIIAHADPITYALLNHGADPNLRNRGNRSTPLIAAVRLRDLNAIRLLMHHGANPNLKDGAGHSAFYYANRTGSPALKKMLEKK